ncbi:MULTISPECIES: RNaseH domain-containing protein [unclassified Clostridium]|uniref:RNaseH domain-containing protein n=1 Tax=unclassified Clostridium TaxID=2614128 RepID=UPI000297B1AF|nr:MULTISPECIES: RNaseH domain-containing protein [unclassified Clostridium]EKQ58024.1 MAG: hypothetical protein A370_00322 [Clostridium sp. Maddingley MBC34-26]
MEKLLYFVATSALRTSEVPLGETVFSIYKHCIKSIYLVQCFFAKENLRIIRMNCTDEIPDYYIYDDKENINKNSGVFKSRNNTYYLVGQKPNTSIKRQTLYEVNIQGAESEEERDSIAKLTQKLRNMNITYNKESSAPLPLYCISRISEYIKAELDGKL